MGIAHNNAVQQSKTYALFIDRLGDKKQLSLEAMRLARLKKTLYLFTSMTSEATTSTGAKMYADKVNGKGRYYPIFFTLTYDIKKHPDYAFHEEMKQWCPDVKPLDRHTIWKPYHITRFIDANRKHWERELHQPREDFRYVWVAELQKDGVIHYHGCLYCPRGKRLPLASNYWNWGRTKTEAVRGGIKGYLMQYLSKGSIKEDRANGLPARYFPKGSRIFGHGGLSSAERGKMRYAKLAKYVPDMFDHTDERIERIKGGWKQAKVELVSPWSYNQGDLLSVKETTQLYNQLDQDLIQVDITNKTENDFIFGVLQYKQKVWLLKDKQEYIDAMKPIKPKNTTSINEAVKKLASTKTGLITLGNLLTHATGVKITITENNDD